MITISADGVAGAKAWAGGAGVLAARGTFGGGTIKAQACDTNSITDSDWIDVGSGTNLASLTAAGSVGFCVPPGWFVRAKLTGSTTPSIQFSMDGVLGRAAAV